MHADKAEKHTTRIVAKWAFSDIMFILRVAQFRRIFGGACLSLFLIRALWASGSFVEKIDESPAIIIGDHVVSNYLVAKYHARFRQAFTQREQREPSLQENAGWMKLFLSQQVIIAHAERLGYASREAVVDLVDRMERHMLTQPNGPFYQQLMPQLRLHEQELKEKFARASRLFDAKVLLFEDTKAVLKELGQAFRELDLQEQSRRLSECRQNHRSVSLIDGDAHWPFGPFEDYADLISSAQPGRWELHSKGLPGLLCIFVRSIATRPSGEFEKQKDEFGSLELQVRQEAFLKHRRATLLKEAHFEVNSPLLQQLAEQCARAIEGGEMKAEAVRPFQTEALCHYTIGSEDFRISAETFRRSYNRRLIKSSLRSALDLRRALEDIVVGEIDLRSARAQGIDRMPQFVQDRLGFAGFQVLDLYEKEVLIPKLKFTSSEIAAYYQRHRSEFERPVKIEVQLLTFSSGIEAAKWLSPPARPQEIRDPSIPLGNERLELTETNSLPGLEAMQPVLFQCQEGTKLGPVMRNGTAVVLVRGKTLERAAAALENVFESIQKRLTRSSLDRSECALAPQLASAFIISDHLNYSAYGAIRKDVAPPWTEGQTAENSVRTKSTRPSSITAD